MKRRNVFLLSLLCFLFLCPRFLQAQSDAKAREILDKTAAAFRQAQAVSITFGGTQEGTLLLKGNKFHLNTGDASITTAVTAECGHTAANRDRKSS